MPGSTKELGIVPERLLDFGGREVVEGNGLVVERGRLVGLDFKDTE